MYFFHNFVNLGAESEDDVKMAVYDSFQILRNIVIQVFGANHRCGVNI